MTGRIRCGGGCCLDRYRGGSVLDGVTWGIGAGVKDVVRNNVSSKSLHFPGQMFNIYGIYLENTGKLVANYDLCLVQIAKQIRRLIC